MLKNLKKDYKKLFFILDKEEKSFFYKMLFFSILVALMESFAIALIMPFMAIASDFSLLKFNMPGYELVFLLSLILAFFYLLRFFINQAYFYKLAKFSRFSYLKCQKKLLDKILSLSFIDFKKSYKSTLLKNLSQESFNFSSFLSSLLLLSSELFVFIFLYSLLCFVSFKICFFLSLYLLLNAFLIMYFINPRVEKCSKEREKAMNECFKLLYFSLDNFTLIKLRAYKERLLELFHKNALNYANSNIKNDFYQSLPRNYLEANAFCIIVLFIGFLIFYTKENIAALLPTISIFLASLYRLLPSINRIISSYNQISFYKNSKELIYESLSLKSELLKEAKLSPFKELCLENISFSYTKNPLLKALNLKAKIGERLLIRGESAEGKSTLAAIIAGLITPDFGKLYINNLLININNLYSYRQKIALISQKESFINGSLLENIQFFEKKDDELAIKLIKGFELASLYEKLRDENIAEDTLSSGQKQRLALARALYSKDISIIILDEACNALDSKTEQRVLRSLYSYCKDKLLIIISHRELKGDFKKYLLKDGKLREEERS